MNVIHRLNDIVLVGLVPKRQFV